jgi:hypothetical protein
MLAGERWAYGQDSVLAALQAGTALTYRIVRDAKGWRVFVSAAVAAPAPVSHCALGAFGVDVNADHLALAETDRFGNLVQALRIDAELCTASPPSSARPSMATSQWP